MVAVDAVNTNNYSSGEEKVTWPFKKSRNCSTLADIIVTEGWQRTWVSHADDKIAAILGELSLSGKT